MKKLGLALGAGGARGACHIGFLKVLLENGITPSFIAGTSMGAVIGGGYAASLDIERMEQTALSVTRQSSLVDFHLFKDTSRLGFINGRRAKKIISKFTNGIATEDTAIPFCCVAADLMSGQKVVLNTGDLYENMRASFAVPVFFQPVKKDGMLLVDGGILDSVPDEEVRSMGADVVIAVDALGSLAVKEPKGIMRLLYRTIMVMNTEITRLTREKNHADLVVTPYFPDVGEIDLPKMRMAIEAGRVAALENLDAIKALLA